MKRREWIMGSVAAMASGMLKGQSGDAAKLDRIAVMSGTFAPLLKGTARPGNPKATIDLMDLAGVVAERFGIRQVEFQQSDFPSTEADYLRDFRRHLEAAHSQISQIGLEFANLNVSSPDPVIRLETIELTKRWIDYAVALGCARVMVNHGDLAPAVRESAVATLKTLKGYAEAKHVSITVQNRPKDVDWQVLAGVIQGAGISADPNCGNFPDAPSRSAGLAALFGMTAGSCHIRHTPEKFDTGEAIRIARQKGYSGIYTIETVPANGRDPYAALRTVLDVVLANS
jgi:hypothetical protein